MSDEHGWPESSGARSIFDPRSDGETTNVSGDEQGWEPIGSRLMFDPRSEDAGDAGFDLEIEELPLIMGELADDEPMITITEQPPRYFSDGRASDFDRASPAQPIRLTDEYAAERHDDVTGVGRGSKYDRLSHLRSFHSSGWVDVGGLAVTAEGLLPVPKPTPILYERRCTDRRTLGLVPEPIERKAQRRGEERRASPRVPRRLYVVDSDEGGVGKVFEGEVGLGGASWNSGYPPLSEQFEVRFRVPEHDEEVAAKAKVIRIATSGSDPRVQVVFTELPLKHELALARYLDRCVSPQ